MHVDRLSILGVGLLGGSLAMAVRAVAKGCRIAGYGHRAETLRLALDLGVIDEAHDDPAAAVRGADLVVLCTPVGTFGDLIRTIGPALAEEAVVTDVGSTKRSIVRVAAGLPAPARFVGSHPMAGSEKRGVEFADADLFRGAVCVLTPTPATDDDATARADELWQAVGMRTIRMTPEEHDARVALASHVPHVVAAALMLTQDAGSLSVAGKGLADTTRVAAGDAGLWRDILLDNRDHVRAGVERLKERLDELLTTLDAADADAVKRWLDRAATERATMQRARDSSLPS